jgi:membrane protease YdiL (CAAX protease family)
MDSPALAQPASNRYPPAAGPIHTIFVLAVLGGWTFYGKILADHLSAAANPNRMRFYVLTLFFEWFLFALVIAGVRHRGAPVLIVLGDRWQSVRQLLRDIGIAAAFWIVSTGILFVLGRLLRVAALGRKMDFILPHGGAEMTMWIALSVTAGICEETIFRGYLQRQFIVLTKNVPAGILLSAAAFGAAHAYQGIRMVTLIGLFGAMFGMLAHWRGSIRPGIIAHAWQDSLNGVLAGVIRH